MMVNIETILSKYPLKGSDNFVAKKVYQGQLKTETEWLAIFESKFHFKVDLTHHYVHTESAPVVQPPVVEKKKEKNQNK